MYKEKEKVLYSFLVGEKQNPFASFFSWSERY